MPPETIAYLGLGSNLGDRQARIVTALRELHQPPIIGVTAVSSLYETKPVGLTEQPDFLNAVAEIRTALIPERLLARILQVEKIMGRVRNQRWGPRVIDIDVLLYGDQQIATADLTVPHPRMALRAFVMIPLAEIAPDVVLPGIGRSAKKIAASLDEMGNISDCKIVHRFEQEIFAPILSPE